MAYVAVSRGAYDARERAGMPVSASRLVLSRGSPSGSRRLLPQQPPAAHFAVNRHTLNRFPPQEPPATAQQPSQGDVSQRQQPGAVPEAHQLESRHSSETTENQSERSRIYGGLGRYGGDGESVTVGGVDGQTVDWERMTAAKRLKPEPTQPGNPHCLTINQHVLPKASIERFSGSDDLVGYLPVATVEAHPRATLRRDLLCQRAWDQRAEHGYMRKIEDAFQEVADRIVTTGVLAGEDDRKLTQFWFLWQFHAGIKENPMEDVKVPGVPALVQTKDAQEGFERKWVLTVGLNGMFSGRSMAGIQMQAWIAGASREKFRWGVVGGLGR